MCKLKFYIYSLFFTYITIISQYKIIFYSFFLFYYGFFLLHSYSPTMNLLFYFIWGLLYNYTIPLPSLPSKPYHICLCNLFQIHIHYSFCCCYYCLSGCAGDYNQHLYNNLIWINTNFIFLVFKNFTFIQFGLFYTFMHFMLPAHICN